MALASTTTATTTLGLHPPCGPFLPSLSSTLSLHRKGLRKGVVAQLPSYGIPSYGAPRPYQTPGADFHNGTRPAETIPNPGFGDITRPGFQWSYGSPADYSTPVNYQTPKGYGAPQAYGPGGTELGEVGGSFDDIKRAELNSGGDGGRGDGDSGSGGRGDGDGEGGDGSGDGEDAGKKLAGLSLSQKLTLAYAVVIGGESRSCEVCIVCISDWIVSLVKYAMFAFRIGLLCEFEVR